MKRRRIRRLFFSRSSLLFLASLSSLLFFLLFPLSCKNRDSQDGPVSKKDGKDGKTAKAEKAKAKEPPLPDTVSVGFYNVENLFDFVLDGTEYDEFKPGWFGWTEEVQKKKLDNAAQVVAAVGVDVIGLCEVENLNVLRELQARLDAMGAPYPHAAVAEAPKSATVTAVLSRFPIVEKRGLAVENSRSILEANIARGGDELRVFVNHWPSKRNAESARLAAAEILAERIGALPPGTDYVILGDMNSNYNEFASFHTEGFNDTKGRTGVNHALKTVAAGPQPHSPQRFVCKGEMAACTGCHYNLWLDLPEESRRSYVYRGAPQTIDHILAPASMFDTSGYSYLDGSFGVFTWDGKLLRDGVPYRWQMVFKGKEKYHKGEGYSDHLPVTARLVRASLLRGGGGSKDNNDSSDGKDAAFLNDGCETIDPKLRVGDFAVTADGWISGDARFSVARDSRFARTGTHSLRVAGLHETENRTAARVRLPSSGAPKHVSLSVRGSGNLSVRVRRPEGKWEYYNAPGFTRSKSARYKPWKSGAWVDLKIPLPEPSTSNRDVDLELRAGKGERLAVWVDRVRLE